MQNIQQGEGASLSMEKLWFYPRDVDLEEMEEVSAWCRFGVGLGERDQQKVSGYPGV